MYPISKKDYLVIAGERYELMCMEEKDGDNCAELCSLADKCLKNSFRGGYCFIESLFSSSNLDLDFVVAKRIE